MVQRDMTRFVSKFGWSPARVQKKLCISLESSNVVGPTNVVKLFDPVSHAYDIFQNVVR